MTEKTPTLKAPKASPEPKLSDYLITLRAVEVATRGSKWKLTEDWWNMVIRKVKALESNSEDARICRELCTIGGRGE